MSLVASLIGRLSTPVEVVAHLAAPRAEVFAVLADPETYPNWLVGAQRIRHVDADFPAPDARFEHSVGPVPSATVDDDSSVVTAEPARRLSLDVHVGPVGGRVVFELLDDPGGAGDRTVLVFRERPTGPAAALTPLLRPILYGRNAASVRRLRRLLEQRRSGAAHAAPGSATAARG